jgi:hypothetical protein
MDGERSVSTPTCPSCGNPMRFARAIPTDLLPQLRTSDCRECGVSITEAVDSQPASTVDRALIVRALLNDGLLVSAPDEPEHVPRMK